MPINGPYISSTQVASSTPFDGTGGTDNGFNSTDTQAAIEEIQVSVVTNISTVATWKDDFISYIVSANGVGELQWQAAVQGTGSVFANSLSGVNDTKHPGQALLGTGSTTTGYSFLNLAPPFLGLYLGGGALIQEWDVLVLNLGVTAQQYTFRFGFGDTAGSEPANGVYFSYANGVTGDFWVIKTAKSSTRTSITTAVAVVANTWYKLRMKINAAATSTEYFIDDVSVGTITTNIPILPVSPFIGVTKTAGTTSRAIEVDYFAMKQILTTPR